MPDGRRPSIIRRKIDKAFFYREFASEPHHYVWVAGRVITKNC